VHNPLSIWGNYNNNTGRDGGAPELLSTISDRVPGGRSEGRPISRKKLSHRPSSNRSRKEATKPTPILGSVLLGRPRRSLKPWDACQGDGDAMTRHGRGRRRRAIPIGSAPVLLLLLGLAGSVSAGWFHGHGQRRPRASEGYAAPIQTVVQFPAAIVWQPGGQIFPIVPPLDVEGAAGAPLASPNFSYENPDGPTVSSVPASRRWR
jgi:hypothetical protein